MAMESGQQKKLSGQSLDDLNIDVNAGESIIGLYFINILYFWLANEVCSFSTAVWDLVFLFVYDAFLI